MQWNGLLENIQHGKICIIYSPQDVEPLFHYFCVQQVHILYQADGGKISNTWTQQSQSSFAET